jgi:fluoroquinolone resistance protein
MVGLGRLILNQYFNAGYIESMVDKLFDKVDFGAAPLPAGEYEDCEFRNCNLSNADLSDMVFIGCRFRDTNLSMAKLSRASFREVVFEGCKMVGLHFEEAIPFLVPPDFVN